MVSNVQKGRLLEKKAREELIKDGYKILFKSMRTRFGCQDFANLFDIVAAKRDDRSYVSVKTFVSNSRHSQHRLDIQEFVNAYGLEGENFALWLWKGHQWEKEIW